MKQDHAQMVSGAIFGVTLREAAIAYTLHVATISNHAGAKRGSRHSGHRSRSVLAAMAGAGIWGAAENGKKLAPALSVIFLTLFGKRNTGT